MFCALLLLAATAQAADLIPLNDLGTRPYLWGYYGGLWDDGLDTIQPDHLADGLRRSALIQPLDANGRPSPDGKIVMLGAGFDETSRIMTSFGELAANEPRINPHVVILNAAEPSFPTNDWRLTTSANYARIKTSVLLPAGVTEKQVQAVWLQMIDTLGYPPLPIQFADAYMVKMDISDALRAMKMRYPNLQVAYLSSRVYGGYGNDEPRAYESAYSVRWVISGQVTWMRTGSLWDTRIGNLDYDTGVAPWASWGPYFWANGTTPRSDGLTWERSDFQSDGATLSQQGSHKAAALLMRFLLTEPTATWFRTGGLERARAARH